MKTNTGGGAYCNGSKDERYSERDPYTVIDGAGGGCWLVVRVVWESTWIGVVLFPGQGDVKCQVVSMESPHNSTISEIHIKHILSLCFVQVNVPKLHCD